MLRAVVPVILGAGTLLGCGCNRISAPQQFTWEVRGDGGSSMIGGGSSSSVRVGNNLLEIKEGRAFANGKDAGALRSGDAILLEKDGRLFVNGKDRAAK